MVLWEGRFAEKADALARRFGDSIGFDQRLVAAEIRASLAYAEALARAGLITAAEQQTLASGLQKIGGEFEAGTFAICPDDEDIHTSVERRLTELVGPVAGKLATGRSRNDQVACDVRLYLLGEATSLRERLIELFKAIVDKSEAHLDVIMPGYTHLRRAQPLLFSHWLMSFFWKFWRDLGRLSDVERRTRACPLGAGAFAGNPFGIDREALAASLGLTVAENSVDAVSDRDFVLEFLFWAALVQVHLSQLAEDLILKREEVKAAITESLSTRLLERGIITETISITDFQFSTTFIAAIEAKVAAEQSVLEARNKLERVKVEAQQREAEAKGEASARIAKAEGEAEYIRVVTEAQVAANNAIASSLTPEVLQYVLLDRLGEDIDVMVIPSGQGVSLVLPEIKQQ